MRGHGIEERPERADDRAGDGRQDEAAEARADQVLDEQRIRLIGRRAGRGELGPKSCQEMIPGMMMMKGMMSFRNAAKMMPSWPWRRLLAASVRWVMNWFRPQ